MGFSLIGGSCLEVGVVDPLILKTGRPACHPVTLTSSLHRRHRLRFARSALPRQRVRSLAQGGDAGRRTWRPVIGEHPNRRWPPCLGTPAEEAAASIPGRPDRERARPLGAFRRAVPRASSYPPPSPSPETLTSGLRTAVPGLYPSGPGLWLKNSPMIYWKIRDSGPSWRRPASPRRRPVARWSSRGGSGTDWFPSGTAIAGIPLPCISGPRWPGYSSSRGTWRGSRRAADLRHRGSTLPCRRPRRTVRATDLGYRSCRASRPPGQVAASSGGAKSVGRRIRPVICGENPACLRPEPCTAPNARLSASDQLDSVKVPPFSYLPKIKSGPLWRGCRSHRLTSRCRIILSCASAHWDRPIRGPMHPPLNTWESGDGGRPHLR
jgi:hypothetical protein